MRVKKVIADFILFYKIIPWSEEETVYLHRFFIIVVIVGY